ncbi:MAG: hypothetical protein QOJ84_5295 [Bradyrhizobium sp.]|nr:hypothetical protein [Bradyrhizobium sp.]
MWRRTDRVSLEKNPSMRFSLEPCVGGEGELEASGRPGGEPSLGFFRYVCGMIVEDRLDRRPDRIGGRNLRNSMNARLRWRSLTGAWTFPVSRSMPANILSVP